MGDSLDLIWGQASRLYYQQKGNRDFYVLDPRPGRDETMLWHKEKQEGWVFVPVISPDGRMAAAGGRHVSGAGRPFMRFTVFTFFMFP